MLERFEYSKELANSQPALIFFYRFETNIAALPGSGAH
jgi:hypothetical protein